MGYPPVMLFTARGRPAPFTNTDRGTASGTDTTDGDGRALNAANPVRVRLDHVGIDVRDLEAQIAFYQHALDLHLEWQGEVRQSRISIAFLLSPEGWRLELLHRDGAARVEQRNPDSQHDVLGIGHIALSCSSSDAVHAAHDRLVQAGASSYVPPTASPGVLPLRAYLADPEGNLIELVERR